MSDFELLQTLQQELVDTLRERQQHSAYITQRTSRARIHRLRLEISEVMARIERQCERGIGGYYPIDLAPETWFGKEAWHEQRTDI